MSSPQAPPVTDLLRAWAAGDPAARDAALPLVYDELRRLAAAHLRRERHGHTLQPTALVHEAFLRLEGASLPWQTRGQFFGLAATMMRRILVDHGRRRRAAKRSGGVRVTLAEGRDAAEPREVDVVALDDALRDLGGFAPRQARIVELRHFGGLSVEETAEVLEVSTATVKREWALARAWLYQQVRR